MEFFKKILFKIFDSKLNAHRRLSIVILNWMILLSIVPICIMGYMWTTELIKQFNVDALKIQKQYYNDQKMLIKKAVDEVI